MDEADPLPLAAMIPPHTTNYLPDTELFFSQGWQMEHTWLLLIFLGAPVLITLWESWRSRKPPDRWD